MQPFVIENFLDPILLNVLQKQAELLKVANIPVDNETFFRKHIHNHPLMVEVHKALAAKACEVFGEELKPSYSFLSMYFEGEGKCPLHVDRPQCYRTIDVCLRKNGDWPIRINHVDKWDEDNQFTIRENAKDYILNEGDAVLYSGTDHPHYRKDAKECGKDIFNDLVFFHFVPKGFQGDLN